MTGWTKLQEVELRRRWEAGELAGPIASALGCGITRNMVIRRAHQLNLHAKR